MIFESAPATAPVGASMLSGARTDSPAPNKHIFTAHQGLAERFLISERFLTGQAAGLAAPHPIEPGVTWCAMGQVGRLEKRLLAGYWRASWG